MKKIIILSCLVTIFSIVTFVSCSKDLDQNINSEKISTKSVVSPDGFLVANNYEELKKRVFNENEIKNIEITSLEYLNIKNKKGAVTFINYTFNGELKNLVLISGNVKSKYKNGSIKFEKAKTIAGDNAMRVKDTVLKCAGLGCCYVGGELSPEGQASFYCKCEGNPSQNSSCTLTVVQTP